MPARRDRQTRPASRLRARCRMNSLGVCMFTCGSLLEGGAVGMPLGAFRWVSVATLFPEGTRAWTAMGWERRSALTSQEEVHGPVVGCPTGCMRAGSSGHTPFPAARCNRRNQDDVLEAAQLMDGNNEARVSRAQAPLH